MVFMYLSTTSENVFNIGWVFVLGPWSITYLDKAFSLVKHEVIVWNNADLLSIGLLERNVSDIGAKQNNSFFIWKCHARGWPFCQDLQMLSTINFCKRSQTHTLDMLWDEFQWFLPLYLKPIYFHSNASCVRVYPNSAGKIHRNWNVDQVSVLITSWDITQWCNINLL